MGAPKLVIENIRNRINELEAERGAWLKKLATATGVERRLVQTAITQIESRLRWYRGRAEGRKPPEANRRGPRRRVNALNAARIAEARP